MRALKVQLEPLAPQVPKVMKVPRVPKGKKVTSDRQDPLV